MSIRQRKKDSKPEKIKSVKKKGKDSDQIWKIVVAMVAVIAIATIAVYYMQENDLEATTARKKKPAMAKSSKTKAPETSDQTPKRSSSKMKSKIKVPKKDPNEPITNAYDKAILPKIEEAEKLLKAKSLVNARKAFENVLSSHPDSPRAMHGLAKSLDELADLMRSNQVLQEAINAYGNVGMVKDCPIALKRQAIFRQADRASFLGKSYIAVKALQNLGADLPQDIEVWNKLGVQWLLIGNQAQAKKTFQQALAINPNDGYAQVHMGFILKTESNYEEAIPHLKRGIDSGESGTNDGRFYFHLGDALYRMGRSKESYEVYESGARHGHFLSRMQRSLYNAQTPLRAQPFWNPKETPYHKYFKMLEKNWKTIRDEGVALYDHRTGGFLPEEEGLREKGDWQQFTIFSQGRKDRSACAKAPKTCSLVEKIPDAAGCKRGQIKFSVMKPGTHVWAHCGPTNCRIRGHLGLVVPNGVSIRVNQTISTWIEGKFIIIDDSIEHEVWHNGTSYRMILIVDFWHPDLPQNERNTLSPI